MMAHAHAVILLPTQSHAVQRCMSNEEYDPQGILALLLGSRRPFDGHPPLAAWLKFRHAGTTPLPDGAAGNGGGAG